MTPEIELYTGILFNPLDPDPEKIDLYDIAHALCNVCRFGGHSDRFRSVASHSLAVANLAKIACLADEESTEYEVVKASLLVFYKGELPEFTKAEADQAYLHGLLHDSAEAYLGDIPAPLKTLPQFAFFRECEDKVMDAIYQKLKIDKPNEKISKIVKWADLFCLQLEARFMTYSGGLDWGIVNVLGELSDEAARVFAHMMFNTTEEAFFMRKAIESIADLE
jgi:hypothetical protein